MRERPPSRCSLPSMRIGRVVAAVVVAWVAVLLQALPAKGVIAFGPEEIVTAGGVPISVSGYSVPSFADWNNNGLNDLVVGEGSGTSMGKVRVYLNVGTTTSPTFSSTFTYAQAGGSDLQLAGAGCMGLFPRVVYWDDDVRKDLLVGDANGYLRLYRNINTDEDPRFDGGALLQVGNPGAKVPINVGIRATPSVVDWNHDGKKDLVAGAFDGKIHVFLNEGTEAAPDFRGKTFAQNLGADLVVASGRSSPVVVDLDGDGRKDLLTGNTNGQLLFYPNTGTDAFPSFSGYTAAESDGIPIDLPGTPRSRPFVCDWTGNGLLDVLIGSADGLVRLYRARIPGDTNGDGRVDEADAKILAAHWGQTGGWSMGDFNNDGVVNALDASIMAANWGRGEPNEQGSPSTAVPEPSVLAMLACLALVAGGRRRRVRSGWARREGRLSAVTTGARP